MKNTETARAAREPGMARRDFLCKSVAIALPATLAGFAKPLFAAVTSEGVAVSTYTLPALARGDTVLNVRGYGALGDGNSNDTAAIQRAINALPSTGGTVDIPAGTYLIDAVTSVRLRSNMHLRLAPDAVLVAIPNSAEQYSVLYASKQHDVEISGGRIIGERDGHSGTTGEWGRGVFIRGSSNVIVRDMHISNCWGDGLVVAGASVWQAPPVPAANVVVANVVSTGNRRQAMSVGYVRGVKVYDSEFSYSNGTSPQCGVDIEPENGNIAYQVLFRNCWVHGNARYGMLLYKGAKSVTVDRCTVENNGSCGIVTRNAVASYISNNTIRNNSATGIFIQDGTSNCQVSRNIFSGNYSRQGVVTRTAFTLDGWSSKIERDIYIYSDTSDIRITTNYYR